MSTYDKVYLIEARTGCTCCSGDNYIFGPFTDKDAATAEMLSMYDRRALASQYARNGRYSLLEANREVLPDGRWILGHYVMDLDEQEPHDLGHPDSCSIDYSYTGDKL